MQSWNFFIYLRFILIVFKQEYLKIGDTHEAQHTFRMFCYEERPFNRKDKVSSFILPEILMENMEINKIPLIFNMTWHVMLNINFFLFFLLFLAIEQPSM